jgi:hypothetical protein
MYTYILKFNLYIRLNLFNNALNNFKILWKFIDMIYSIRVGFIRFSIYNELLSRLI